ncbi:MAG TPA: DinB family protein [Terriglobales bacterium]
MKLTDFFLSELEAEAAGTRHAIERVPEGRNDWKPHEKSMALGYLAALVATMPGWIEMMINTEELDFSAPDRPRTPELKTAKELVHAFDDCMNKARKALAETSDEHLLKPWRLRAGAHILNEEPRYKMIQNSVFNHLAHHRGQLTVYLRLTGAKVPAIYGPSADEGSF